MLTNHLDSNTECCDCCIGWYCGVSSSSEQPSWVHLAQTACFLQYLEGLVWILEVTIKNVKIKGHKCRSYKKYMPEVGEDVSIAYFQYSVRTANVE